MSNIALVDCNNFYASCERIFNPKLYNVPIAVLSNNDGCVIARSDEAKKLGIGMADPVFKYEHLIKKHNIHVCSANFSLYGDISHRVMDILSQFTPHLEIYSIDEAFLALPIHGNIEECVRTIRQKVLQGVGIPISIGIASTKTLAKVANKIAKKHTQLHGVFHIENDIQRDEVLKSFPVYDVWGIGWQSSKKLFQHGVSTAGDFVKLSEALVLELMTISGLKIQRELQGISSIQLEDIHETKKSIASTRSFGKAVETLKELEEAVSSYTARATEKLRDEEAVAWNIHIFIHTNLYKDGKQYNNMATVHLYEATDYTPSLIHKAKEGLFQIYKKGYKYKKAGVILTGITPKNQVQMNLFQDKTDNTRQQQLMKTVDRLNYLYGHGTVQFVAEGTHQTWKARSEKRSQNYTTRWQEIPVVR